MTRMRPPQAPVIFDIHGVLLGRTEPPGHRPAGEIVDGLRRAGYPVRFLTNGSSNPRAALCAQLAQAGIEAEAAEVFTAAHSAAHYLRRRGDAGEVRRVWVIGSPALREEIRCGCGRAVEWAAVPEEADTVVVSRDPSLTDDLLARLANVASLDLIATCRDRQFPAGAGLETGPGPTVVRVEQALRRSAHVVGKPNPYVLTQVMGLGAELLPYTVVVGDSPEQDIALARRAGARSVLLAGPGPGSSPSAGAAPARDPAPVASDPSHEADHTIRALDQLMSLLEVTP